MIDRQEIMEFAREFGLAPNVVEKDYVLGWLLAGSTSGRELNVHVKLFDSKCMRTTGEGCLPKGG